MDTDRTFYFDHLYPLQDRVLGLLREIETGFYLSGGTAASRGYLHHRFSDGRCRSRCAKSASCVLLSTRRE